jgi:hypothetical protein
VIEDEGNNTMNKYEKIQLNYFHPNIRYFKKTDSPFPCLLKFNDQCAESVADIAHSCYRWNSEDHKLLIAQTRKLMKNNIVSILDADSEFWKRISKLVTFH